ncbi:MAG: hypothetical protein IJ542_02900 [Clostridia bacterium]|nr:hypothetical protein [Clostridia bacterium]
MDFENVWSVIVSIVSESGVWAMLFVALLIILISSNNKREEKYQEIIRALANALKKVEEIKEDVEDIKFSMGIGGNSKLTEKEDQKDDTKREDENL